MALILWDCWFRNAKRFTLQHGCRGGVPMRLQGLPLAHTVYTNSKTYSWEEVVVWVYNVYDIDIFNEGKLCYQKYQFMKVNNKLSLGTIWNGDRGSTDLPLKMTIGLPRATLDAFTSGCQVWDTGRDDCSSSKFLWDQFQKSHTKCPK